MSPSVSLRRTALAAVGCCLLAVLTAGLALGTIPGAGDAPAPVPEIVSDANTSNYLNPPTDGEVRQGSDVQGVNVGLAAARDAESLVGNHERAILDHRFEGGIGPQAGLEHVRRAYANLSDRTARLREVSRATRAAYRVGDLSEEEFLYRTARIEAAANRASAYREEMVSHLEDIGARSHSLYTDVQGLQPELQTLTGPVADILVNRHTGNVSSGSTYVRVTGTGGYVMSTVASGRFYREAQVSDDWNRDGEDQFASDEDIGPLSRARSRAFDLYPWATSHPVGLTNTPGPFTVTTLYPVILNHQHGEIRIYFDGTTTDVFREHQSKLLNELPMNWQRTTTDGDLRLNVSGTYPTGPLQVNVTRASTGVQVGSNIQINGTEVGRTVADGRLWTVQPAGAFTVSATSGEDSVRLIVTRERD